MKDSLVEEESSMEDGAMLQTGAERSSFTPPSGRSSWPGGRAAGTRNLPSLPPLPSVRAPIPSPPNPASLPCPYGRAAAACTDGRDYTPPVLPGERPPDTNLILLQTPTRPCLSPVVVPHSPACHFPFNHFAVASPYPATCNTPLRSRAECDL